MAKRGRKCEHLLNANGGRFETAEFEEWLNLEGALEALSPTRSTNLGFSSTTTRSGSLTQVNPKLRLSNRGEQGIPPWSNVEYSKRKASRPNNEGDRKPTKSRGKKTSHNVIEKRYRSNLNDKIATLRDSVPALRTTNPRGTAKDGQSETEDSEDKNGATSKLKLNKASVLTKATEYIKQLERQNECLLQQNSILRNRLHTVDTPPSSVSTTLYELVKSSDSPMTDTVLSPPEIQIKEDSASSTISPTGMIPVPEEFRRLRMGASEEHYAPEEDLGTGTRGRVMSRLLLGSLASLMVMEGLSEVESDRTSDKPGSRGLFALPQELLKESRGFRDPIRRRIIAFAHSIQPHEAMSLMKLFFISIILFVVFICVFDPGQKVLRMDRPSQSIKVQKVASPPRVAQDEVASSTKEVAPVQDLVETEDLPVVMNIRGFFARQAIAILGYSWLQPNSKDEEAAGLPSVRAQDSRRRWRAYADLLPKLLEESHGD